MPAPKTEKLGTLIDCGVAVQNMCATIVACGLNEHLCNVALLQELVERLPPTIKLDWARYRQVLNVVTLSDFSAWLETLVEAACAVTVPSSFNSYASKTDKRGRKEEMYVHVESEGNSDPIPASTSRVASSSASTACVICREACGNPSSCRTFRGMKVSDRWAALNRYKLCRKCLSKHFDACPVKKVCGKNGCTYMHHNLLHDDSRYQRRDTPQRSLPVVSDTTVETCNTHSNSVNKVLFRYVPVLLHGRGKSIRVFAFLNDGSSVTWMDHSLLSELGIQGEAHPLCLGWTSDHQRQEPKSVKLSLQISGVHDSKLYTIPKVHTVQSLALPRQSLALNDLTRRYKHLRSIPVDSYRDATPRILIGMDNCHLRYALDSKEGDKQEPIATRTRLGWIVCGPCAVLSQPVSTAYHSFHVCPCYERNDAELHKAVKSYFTLDSIGLKTGKQLLSKDDERAEQLLKSLTRVKGKRYETGLLWRGDDIKLPDSKPMASRRLVCLEKRMQRDPCLAESLKEKVRDYERRGYIEKLTERQLSAKYPRVWYLPIFPVTNLNKPGKLRIVWDAAAKVAGVSLNSCLLTGPDLLTSLVSVLHRFREFRIAITGDIREMFLQVMMNENDQQCLRFLWRNGESDRAPDVYALKVMAFGATCSPSSAQFVKNQNAQRFIDRFPRAVEAIMEEHYVDDMLSSVETEDEAIKLAKDVQLIHAEAGFEIRNWLSNSNRVLQELESSPDARDVLCWLNLMFLITGNIASSLQYE
ncbi:uncharacterized protein LOC131427935 [Malaya genurostris]|uniref:uncharacterized protein LOC131427935 n=1 Tax=Malaya genurostris TaxID=325434 RepID=UPI0026F394B1|nr:uncharacterized protein LOC131427935 [Malaya genurostris]